MWERRTYAQDVCGLESWLDSAGADLWQGRDAEGREAYCVTFRLDGVSVMPAGARYYYSPKTAILAAKNEYEAPEMCPVCAKRPVADGDTVCDACRQFITEYIDTRLITRKPVPSVADVALVMQELGVDQDEAIGMLGGVP